jgi:hypothetical protein
MRNFGEWNFNEGRSRLRERNGDPKAAVQELREI